MARKAGLGRGLDALFADVAPISEEEYAAEKLSEPVKADSTKKAAGSRKDKTEKEAQKDDRDRILYIDINNIKPNSAQPRLHFDEEKLGELAESIRTNGVIQPLIVREGKNGYLG